MVRSDRRVQMRSVGQVLIPFAALVVLALEWGRSLPTWAVVITGIVLAAAVLIGVFHAEVVAHRVGEPLGSLVLAVAVTVIEVGLILALTSGGHAPDTLARDTVFAEVMITCNGIVGLCLVLAAWRKPVVTFSAEGTGSALAAVATIAVLSLVLPTLTTSAKGPVFTSTQLVFAAVTSFGVWVLFVAVQTVRNRDWFQPLVDPSVGDAAGGTDEQLPSNAVAMKSFGLMVLSLVAVVGLAKVMSPSIERGVVNVGLPVTIVGVIIAMLVLLPETIAAARSVRRGDVQKSFNLAYGSAMASIGLTIPVIAIVSLMGHGSLTLGLAPSDIGLLGISVAVGILTVAPGKATMLQGGLHLALFAGFVVLAANP
jgi:Ca2+:H+ antiporter